MTVPSSTHADRMRLLRKAWRALSAQDRAAAVRATSRAGQGGLQTLRMAVIKALRMRPATVQGWSPQQLADASAKIVLDEQVLADLLIAFHLTERVPLLTAFLDAAGVPHTEGATDPDASTGEIDPARVQAAADLVSKDFPERDAQVYFATLIALEGGAWEALAPRLDETVFG